MAENYSLDNKIALQGEVAQMLLTSSHPEEMYYRMYYILSTLPESYREEYIEAFRELLDESERGMIDRIVLEVVRGEVPLWLWIERTLADIRLFIQAPADLSLFLPLNPTEARKRIARSVFALFTRRVFLICPQALILLINRIFELSPAFDYLETFCFMVKDEVQEAIDKLRERNTLADEYCEEILDLSINFNDTINYTRSKEAKEAKKVRKSKSKATNNNNKELVSKMKIKITYPQDNVEDKAFYEQVTQEILELITRASNGDPELEGKTLPKKTKDKEKTGTLKFKVVKKFKGSEINTSLGMFKTEEEAKEFVQSIINNYPEILNTCDIKIIRCQK